MSTATAPARFTTSSVLDECSVVPTPEEHANLAKRVRAAAVAREILEESELAPADKARLRRVVRDGDEARQRMVTGNMRLVAKLANRYQRERTDSDDLVQDGVAGLIKAIDRFDPARGYRFSTYATLWIKQAIQQGLAASAYHWNVPRSVTDELPRIADADRLLSQKLGREPTDQELSEQVGLSVARIQQVRDATRSSSLDQPAGEGRTLRDWVAATTDAGAQDRVAAAIDHRSALGNLLGDLGELERDALLARLGLGPLPPMDRQEVADRFELSASQVAELETRTLSLLRHPSTRDALDRPDTTPERGECVQGGDATRGRYVNGCRCEPCCDANTEYVRKWRERKRKQKAQESDSENRDIVVEAAPFPLGDEAEALLRKRSVSMTVALSAESAEQIPAPGDWTKRAACRGSDPKQFFAVQPNSDVPCVECPVRDECLLYSVATPGLKGTWGGTTSKERVAVRQWMRNGN